MLRKKITVCLPVSGLRLSPPSSEYGKPSVSYLCGIWHLYAHGGSPTFHAGQEKCSPASSPLLTVLYCLHVPEKPMLIILASSMQDLHFPICPRPRGSAQAAARYLWLPLLQLKPHPSAAPCGSNPRREPVEGSYQEEDVDIETILSSD